MDSKTDNIVDILQLINSENLGPVTFYKLLQQFGTVKAAIENISGIKKVKLLARDKAKAIYEYCLKNKINIITYSDDSYPNILFDLNDAPPILFAKGDVSLLNHNPAISIVGARNASINGRKIASRIAFDLSNNDVMVVSGMARGIDAAAHKGAMYAKNQKGATIAVLGTGIDIPYPDENKNLYEQIIEQGCLISEFTPGTLPQTANFPRRNRIVAAISSGTLVVEATSKSGSLITAQLASEYGRSIFAVPGAPSEPRSCGPNNLIKCGANLTGNAQDIIKIINSNNSIKPTKLVPLKQSEFVWNNDTNIDNDNKIQKTKIIDYLNSDGVYVDEIIRISRMSASEVALELLNLEMNGMIERQSGNKVALIKRK